MMQHNFQVSVGKQGLDKLGTAATAELDEFAPLAWQALRKTWPTFCDASDTD